MSKFGEYKVYINKDKDDELLDKIRNGYDITYSDLYPNTKYVIPPQKEKIFTIRLENPKIKTEYDATNCKLTVTQDISDFLTNDNIIAFRDKEKLYFMDKSRLEIVAEFDVVK